MLPSNQLRVGTYFILDGQPYEVLEFSFLKMQQRRPVSQTKIKNLINGKIISRNFHQSESFAEADVSKSKVKFLYSHRDEYWFCEENNPAARFKLSKDILGESARYLKPNTAVDALSFEGKIINVIAPIKVDVKVTEAPPGVKGDTAQGATKSVVIETGASINVPLFINEGDIIRVNTKTGEYAERVSKA